MYIAPGKGQTTPWGQNFESTEIPYHFAHLWPVLKNIALKSDFYPFFVCLFSHVYSPRAGADNPYGTNVDVNRNTFSLCPFVASFKKHRFEVWFFTLFLCVCFHMYIAPGRGWQTNRTKILWQEKGLFFLPICCKFQNDVFKFWFYTHF